MSSLRAVVVEDEPLPRRELCALLAERGVSVIGEAGSADAARKLLSDTDADVAFLDIQLGRKTAFDLLDGLDASFAVVFVTAYEDYAIRAFDVAAVDYLLKPVDPERLDESLARVGRSEGPPPGAPLSLDNRLFVRDRKRWRFIQVRSIVAIEADGDYTLVRVEEGPPLLLGTPLKQWEATLPEATFARIHRSTIVNLDHVTEVEEWFNRTYRVHVRSVAEPYQMSRRAARKLKG